MRFQKQNLENNCFDACIASILDLDINTLPNYKGDRWEFKMQKWLNKNYNKTILFINYNDYTRDSIPLDIPYIVSCELKEGGWHSRVYMNCEMIFDPSPKEYPRSHFKYDNMKAEFILNCL